MNRINFRFFLLLLKNDNYCVEKPKYRLQSYIKPTKYTYRHPAEQQIYYLIQHTHTHIHTSHNLNTYINHEFIVPVCLPKVVLNIVCTRHTFGSRLAVVVNKKKKSYIN